MMSNIIVAVFAVLFLAVAFALYVVIRTTMSHDDVIDTLLASWKASREDVHKAYETAQAMRERADDTRKALEGQISAISEKVERLHARTAYSPEKGGYNDARGVQVVAEVKVHTEKAASANKWALVKTEEGESVAHFNQQFFTMVTNTDIYHLDEVEFTITAVKRNGKV